MTRTSGRGAVDTCGRRRGPGDRENTWVCWGPAVWCSTGRRGVLGWEADAGIGNGKTLVDKDDVSRRLTLLAALPQPTQ